MSKRPTKNLPDSALLKLLESTIRKKGPISTFYLSKDLHYSVGKIENAIECLTNVAEDDKGQLTIVDWRKHEPDDIQRSF